MVSYDWNKQSLYLIVISQDTQFYGKRLWTNKNYGHHDSVRFSTNITLGSINRAQVIYGWHFKIHEIFSNRGLHVLHF